MQALTNRYHETAINELRAIQTSLSSRFAGEKLSYKKAIEFIPIYKRENEAYRKQAQRRLKCEGTVLRSLVLLPSQPALQEAIHYHRVNFQLIDSVIDKTLEYDKYADRSLALFKEKLVEHLMEETREKERERVKAVLVAEIERGFALHQIKQQERILDETHASYYKLKTRLATMRFWPVSDRNTARIAFRTNAFESLVCKRELAKSRIAGYCISL